MTWPVCYAAIGALTPRSSPARHWRANSAAPTIAKNTNERKDQLAIEPPRKVQSILVQSPLPLKIMGMTRCSGKFSIIP